MKPAATIYQPCGMMHIKSDIGRKLVDQGVLLAQVLSQLSHEAVV